MSRKPLANQFPIATFSLIGQPPLLTTDALLRLGGYFVSNPNAIPSPRATLDPQPCPYCGGKVEWAQTATTKPADKTPNNPTGIKRYVFARCQTDPQAHRWGFRDTETSRAVPKPPPSPVPNVVQPKPTPTENPDVSTNPFAAFESWIEEKVGARVTAAEDKIASLKAGMSEADVQALIDLSEKPLPADKIKAMIAEIVGSMRLIRIEVPARPEISFEGRAHPQLAVVLKYIAAGERFFLLVGPAATGKSTLAGQVAEALKVKHYAALAVTETLQREDLLGCRAHNLTTGTVSYRGTPIVEAWEQNGVICLDEVDRGNANTLCALNSIEQGCLYVPRAHDEGGPVAKSDKAIVIATANTYGTGANRTYAGANQLDAAFLDRWRVIEVGYDADLEVAVCGGDASAKACVDYLRACRERADRASVRRPLTTRFARRAATDMRIASKPLMVKEAMLAEAKGWTPTEISTVFQ